VNDVILALNYVMLFALASSTFIQDVSKGKGLL